jgi:hypothetical protein
VQSAAGAILQRSATPTPLFEDEDEDDDEDEAPLRGTRLVLGQGNSSGGDLSTRFGNSERTTDRANLVPLCEEAFPFSPPERSLTTRC